MGSSFNWCNSDDVKPYPNVNMQTSMPFYLLTVCDLFPLCWGTQGLTVRSERFWVKHYLAIFHDLLTRLHSWDYGLLHARINHIFPHFTHTPLPTRTKFHKLVRFSRYVILFCLRRFVFKRLFYLKKKAIIWTRRIQPQLLCEVMTLLSPERLSPFGLTYAPVTCINAVMNTLWLASFRSP